VCFGCFSAYFVFLAKIDVCRVRPCVIGRAPLVAGCRRDVGGTIWHGRGARGGMQNEAEMRKREVYIE
jgi:hypothetical protein